MKFMSKTHISNYKVTLCTDVAEAVYKIRGASEHIKQQVAWHHNLHIQSSQVFDNTVRYSREMC